MEVMTSVLSHSSSMFQPVASLHGNADGAISLPPSLSIHTDTAIRYFIHFPFSSFSSFLLLLFLLFFGDSIIITWKIEEKWRYSSPVVDVKLATLRSPTKRFFFPLQVIQFLTLLACGFTLRPPDI